MKHVVGLAVLALSIALPAQANVVPLKGAQLIADWDSFAAAEPSRPTMEALHADLKACHDEGCLKANSLQSGDIERLAWWVARGNRMAIRLSFAASELVDNGSDGAQALSQSYGTIIKHDPTAFLAMAHDEGASGHVLAADATATSDLIAGNYTAQKAELMARRTALVAVDDVALAGLRDLCVAKIDAQVAMINPKVGSADDDGVYHVKKESL